MNGIHRDQNLSEIEGPKADDMLGRQIAPLFPYQGSNLNLERFSMTLLCRQLAGILTDRLQFTATINRQR
jgi:hypothetical protein